VKLVAAHFGIQLRQHGTSHVVFMTDSGAVAPIPVARPLLPVYIKNFLKLLEK
jgi:hypothetical protein